MLTTVYIIHRSDPFVNVFRQNFPDFPPEILPGSPTEIPFLPIKKSGMTADVVMPLCAFGRIGNYCLT